MTNNAVIFGYSGHAYVVIDILLSKNYNIAGYFDKENKTQNPFKINYLGDENANIFKEIENCDAFMGIGDNKIRADIFQMLVGNNINCPVAVHDKSIISKHTRLGAGSVVMAGAVINAMAIIGNAVICNSASVIEHECIIGNYAHIAPGAVLAANVTVGERSFIGASSVIKQGITIGSDVVIGAGSVVVRNVPDGSIVYGNPAK